MKKFEVVRILNNDVSSVDYGKFISYIYFSGLDGNHPAPSVSLNGFEKPDHVAAFFDAIQTSDGKQEERLFGFYNRSICYFSFLESDFYRNNKKLRVENIEIDFSDILNVKSKLNKFLEFEVTLKDVGGRKNEPFILVTKQNTKSQ